VLAWLWATFSMPSRNLGMASTHSPSSMCRTSFSMIR
jgi:hypothetical protein